MEVPRNAAFINTLRERCRMCYTCVRECPAKAIRIVEGQAEIVPKRCIACGNCVRVCSQGAKQVISTIEQTEEILRGRYKVAAVVAPSFAAEFPNVSPERLVGMIRALGFSFVNEVAFGADLVADRYRKLLSSNGLRRYIATTCPAIIAYVERYHPELVKTLAPIVSPMVAIARVLHRRHGEGLRVVFIGPCIAKKAEGSSALLGDEISSAITFAELREMFSRACVVASETSDSEFDPPRAGVGAIFPLSRGMLQTAGIGEDLMTGDVVAADGRSAFVDAIKDFESGAMDARLLEVLACQGCIMGAGMTSQEPLFSRRKSISNYARERMIRLDKVRWKEEMERENDLDLSRTYTSHDQRIPTPSAEQMRKILEAMGKFDPEDELNCGACGYETCRAHATAIYKGLAENEMCLPYMVQQLSRTVSELNLSHKQLANAQEALMHSEKLASMGQLAAGIAHELNNPLGVVLMYAHMLLEEQAAAKPELGEDLSLIAKEADRCKKIVSGLLHFARQNKVVRVETPMAEVVSSALARSTVPSGIKVERHDEDAEASAELDADQVVQVLLNLIENAAYAMDGGGTLTLSTAIENDRAIFRVADTGVGIPEENRKKIFEPFFTTKELGKGTGLGLAVSYGIVKMHCGDITVQSNADPDKGSTGTVFTVSLPLKGREGSAPGASTQALVKD